MSAITKGCAVAAAAAACGVAGVSHNPPARLAYCLDGRFLDLEAGQPEKNPAYAGATPAHYLAGIGVTCDTLTGYTAAGYAVDGDGNRGGSYPFYVKSTETEAAPSTAPVARPASRERGVAWAGTRFTSKQTLQRWLKRHGVTWNGWARNHPAAAAKLGRGA